MIALEWLQSGQEWLVLNGLDFVKSLVEFFIILILGKVFISMIRRSC